MDQNYVPLRTVNDKNTPPYLYPRALVKQLNIANRTANPDKNDFTLILNNFKPKNNNETSSSTSQEYGRKIIHEMIHGMGFVTQLKLTELKKEEIKSEMKEKRIGNEDVIDKANFTDIENLKVLPSRVFYFDDDDFEELDSLDKFEKAYENSKFIGFSPLTIFTKNIVDINTKKYLFENSGFLYQELNSCFNVGSVSLQDYEKASIEDCFNSLKGSTKDLISSLTKNYFFKHKSLGFLTSDGQVIPLQTFDGEFYSGTSIDHIDSTNVNSNLHDINPFLSLLLNKDNLQKFLDEEFLMYFTEFDNFPLKIILDSLLVKNNKHGLIGPGTINILKTLGWAEKGENFREEQYYYADDIQYPTQNKFKTLLLKEYELSSSAYSILYPNTTLILYLIAIFLLFLFF